MKFKKNINSLIEKRNQIVENKVDREVVWSNIFWQL